ncbi:MAG: pyrimidine-nucleoside phosphorylase [Saprospiraceae bacterium]|nr:pyrimidine-nucleoside phosphorylase [Saprospiraceae bacterium]
MVELILKKKHGYVLSESEIDFMVQDFTSGRISDYQMSAMLMAICFKGLNDEETTFLTHSMVHSGEVVDLSSIPGIKVDKHSTGGVGDKTTLILGPLVAAAGVPVAKMSGRGLGHTGGTLDKLESIPGFSVDLSTDQFLHQVKTVGLAVCAQNTKLVPADKKLYALRDVTGTVDNISLIASSIMSKKLASGADAIVIDIKVGDGAFMKTVKDAEHLANMMINIAAKMGKKLVAVITGMDQPLGYEVGNVLEVKEAVKTLRGEGPDDLTEVCITLAAHMLVLAGKYSNLDTARQELILLIKNGKAFEKFLEFVKAQRGDTSFIEKETFPESPVKFDFVATKDGYIARVLALEIGNASVCLGAGRETKDSSIDPLAGITLIKKQGDRVKQGDVLATLFTSDQKHLEKALEHMKLAYEFSEEVPEKQPLIFKTVL